MVIILADHVVSSCGIWAGFDFLGCRGFLARFEWVGGMVGWVGIVRACRGVLEGFRVYV